MHRKRLSENELQSLCGQVHPDDGVDPAEYFRPSRKKNSPNRKVRQLCQQVAERLSLVLSGEFGDELRDLRIVSIAPAPDASQLLVLVGPAVGSDALDPQVVLDRLAAAAGVLRHEVTAAITRRRAPKLLFRFVQAGEAPT